MRRPTGHLIQGLSHPTGRPKRLLGQAEGWRDRQEHEAWPLAIEGGVGIRLARPTRAAPAAVPVSELARRLRAWISVLHDHRALLSGLDQLIADALTTSQADVGLGPQVAASAWEPLHG